MSKKSTAAGKSAKKEKPAPLFPKEPKAKAAKPAKTSAKFVSLSVRAVIPTQSYGNIQPEVMVTANTFEEARAFAMPMIEALYGHYAESKPGFLGKIEVTEKVVAPAPAPKAEEPKPTPSSESSVEVSAPQSSGAPTSSAEKPAPVLKAEKAISLAMTEEAATLIQDQIEKSVKIPQEFKQDLLTLCLKRRKELEGK